ncbi:MAG TPA: alpha/beta hydrolase [Anaerolineae bacterium]|nr:alpha/beta hydrolase [Anaerolineae bacterium]
MQLDLLHNFGGNGPVIHLAHANGFPPGAYRLLAETLISDYRVIALPSRPILPGSHPTSAPTWHPLAEDLIEGLDGLGLGGIVGVGHSLGGVLTMWAAIRRPDLFRAVILIEPVILPPSWLRMLRIMRALGLQQRQPLVQGAQRRRRTWPNRQACFEQYRSKTFFAHWPDEALWDYVHYGTRAGGDDAHVELVYPPEWEAHIFATTPLDIWHAVPELHTRALIIRGEHSTTFQPAAEARMARLLPQARFATIAETGHFLPMERTAVLGRAIKEFLLEITPGRGPGWSGGQAGVAV